MVCLGQYFQHISYHPPLSNAAERRLSARAWAPSQAQLPAFKFRQEPELHCGSRPPRRALQPAGGGACLGEPGHARPESVSENRRHPSPSAPPEQRAVWTARGSVPPPGAPGAGPGGSAGAQEAGMRSTATGARSLFAGSAGGSDAGPLPGRAAAAASHARPCRKTVAIRVPRRPRRHRPRSAPGAAAMRLARALTRRPEAPPRARSCAAIRLGLRAAGAVWTLPSAPARLGRRRSEAHASDEAGASSHLHGAAEGTRKDPRRPVGRPQRRRRGPL